MCKNLSLGLANDCASRNIMQVGVMLCGTCFCGFVCQHRKRTRGAKYEKVQLQDLDDSDGVDSMAPAGPSGEKTAADILREYAQRNKQQQQQAQPP